MALNDLCVCRCAFKYLFIHSLAESASCLLRTVVPSIVYVTCICCVFIYDEHYRKCAHSLPSLPLHLWSGRDCTLCRHTVDPLCFLSFALPRERYLSGRYWPCKSLSLWVKCSQLWQCSMGVDARIDSLKDFHLRW